MPFTDDPNKAYQDAQKFLQEDFKKYGGLQP